MFSTVSLALPTGRSLSFDPKKKRRASDKDVRVSEKAQKTLDPAKRQLEAKEFENRLTKKLRKDNDSPVIEIPRDEAFYHAHQAKNEFYAKLLKKLGKEGVADLDIKLPEAEEEPGIELRPYQYKEIEEVQDKRSGKAASQLFELYQILESRLLAKKEDGLKLLAFARSIIEQIPEKQKVAPEEVEDKYHDVAEKLAEELPFELPEKYRNMVAEKMKQFYEMKEDDQPPEEKQAELEQLPCKQMGYLLFMAQHHFRAAVECVSADTREKALEMLADRTSDILEQACGRIDAHEAAHRKTAIQGIDEAVFHKMSLEMAELLLLETGSINFGIIDEVAEVVIPERFQNTEAVKHMKIVLEDLADNYGGVWSKIARQKLSEEEGTPSDQATRACMGLSRDGKKTKRHLQIMVLSALLGHMRQAKAGTCFATAWIIKALLDHLGFFVDDLVEMTEKSYVTRIIYGVERKIPFFAKMSREYLDTIIEVGPGGRLISTEKYERDILPWHQPQDDAFLHEAPGILAACRAIEIETRPALESVLPRLPAKFTVHELMKELAAYAHQRQAQRSDIWAKDKLTLEQFLDRAEYAFGAQTNHPLHRAYEQVAASIVDYFSTEFGISILTHITMEEAVKHGAKGHSLEFQSKYRRLLQETLLPMASRMKFRYNHRLQEPLKLFDDDNHGVRENHTYGYELYDSGLPDDFEYSTNLYKAIKTESSCCKVPNFHEQKPITSWKAVNSEEKFVEFLHNVIHETTEHLIGVDKGQHKEIWKGAAQRLCEEVSRPANIRSMIGCFFGKNLRNTQSRKLLKNEHTMETKPWLFLWGGNFDAVLRAYFGFAKFPAKLTPFQGSQREVLAKCIDLIKRPFQQEVGKRKEELQEQFEDLRNQMLMASPVHAFLLTPSTESFQKAWKSGMETGEYIRDVVERPGLEVANSRLNPRTRSMIVNFVSENKWYRRCDEKDDFERQMLSLTSQQAFDRIVRETDGLLAMSTDEFEKTIQHIVALSRAEDPKIGKRNSMWESRFNLLLRNKVNTLVPPENREQRISVGAAREIADFARNRVDSNALSETAQARFIELMQEVPRGQSVTAFRNSVADAAYKAHCEDIYGKDDHWKKKFCEFLDTKLFSLLPEAEQLKVIEAGVVTHDANWKRGIHDCHMIFMINPGTGKLGLYTYLPDLKKVEFLDQDIWFPQYGPSYDSPKDPHGQWRFPDYYRAWADGPTFNMKKLLGIL